MTVGEGGAEIGVGPGTATKFIGSLDAFGGLSRWTSVTMETLVGPGLHGGQLQVCKPGWSGLLKSRQKGTSVLSDEDMRIQYELRCWMHHEHPQLRTRKHE